MSRYRKKVIAVLEELKAQDPFAPLFSLPIYDIEKNFAGWLFPVTWNYRAILPDCAAQLAQWRNENPSFSPDRFEATEESTAKWLDCNILGREDRVLFLILSADGVRVGHIGFSGLDERERSFEVDAVLRGAKTCCPGIMGSALHTLVRWGLKELRLRKITLRVLSENTGAIHFYKHNCFFKTADIPLYQVIGPGREKWVTVKQNEEQVPEKFYSRMQLDIEKWKRVNAVTDGGQ